jgi:hypothetical protein
LTDELIRCYDQGMTMSAAATDALINAGKELGPGVSANVIKELMDEGLVGARQGITRKGTIERGRIINARLDEMFG